MRSFYADGLKDLYDDTAPSRRPARKKSPRAASTNAARESPPAVNDPRQNRALLFDPLSSGRAPRRSSEYLDPDPVATDALSSAMRSSSTPVLEDASGQGSVPPVPNSQECDLIDEFVKAMNAMNADSQQQDPPDETDPMLSNGLDIADMFMKQLLAKEVLYEPLKEITRNYVEWLESGALQTLPGQERIRHHNLCNSFEDIVNAYETDPNNVNKLMNLFHTAQSYGAPPEHIYERLLDNPESLNFQQEGGLPGCITQ